jgi:HEAT repeat protein
VKWAAAYLLAKTMYPPAVAALREALAEGDTRTRRMAVEAIVDIGGEGCEEELSLAAELDADPAVRLMAGVFTGSGGTTGFKQNIPDRSTAGIPRSLDTLPGLLNRLSNEAPEVRAFAASVLGQTGKREAAPGLFELLFDEDERVVIEARRALDSLPT